MSSESPYTPPKSIVEVPVDSKLERRLLRSIDRLLDDEAGRLAFMRRLAWSMSAMGIVFMAWSAFFAARSDWGVAQAVVAIIGGYFVGVSSFYFRSLRNWPILRRYLDVDRIRADCAKSAS